MFSNENQQLKRQMKRQLSYTLSDFEELQESSDQSSLLLAVTSPSTKRLSLQKTSWSIARKFHLDRLYLDPFFDRITSQRERERVNHATFPIFYFKMSMEKCYLVMLVIFTSYNLISQTCILHFFLHSQFPIHIQWCK